MTTGRGPDLITSIVDAIGGTPLVELARYARHIEVRGRLLLKLEYLNPGFSKKDRIALEMVHAATADGSLRPGQTVVELTSGNTGTGLAIVCRALGHPFVAVMSRGNTTERARMMQALGADVVLVDQAPGSPPNEVSGADLALVDERAANLVDESGAFRADQFELDSSALAHERHTGPEIWQQAGGDIDVFVDFVGSGGSFAGVTAALRKFNPELRSYVVEPEGAAALAGREATRPNHKIQGGGYNMAELTLIDPESITGFLTVDDDEAIAAARLLAAEEGVFAGFSTGANLAAATKLLRSSERGCTIALLACDSGLKYLSTDLYPWREPGAT